MKRTVIYQYILLVALIMGVASASTYVWQSVEPVIHSLHPQEEAGSDSQSESYFSTFEAMPATAGISRLQTRTPNQNVKTDSNWYLFRLFCVSHLTTQQFFTTKSSYNSFCSRKELKGYYIYALRKLLI